MSTTMFVYKLDHIINIVVIKKRLNYLTDEVVFFNICQNILTPELLTPFSIDSFIYYIPEQRTFTDICRIFYFENLFKKITP